MNMKTKQETPVNKNDVITARIVDITNEGAGVAKLDNFTVFVPFTCTGELVETKILKVMPKYAYGKLTKVIEASADRIDPDCKVYDRCGGCSLRHMSYPKETQIKESQVYDTLQRLGNQNMEGVIKHSIIASQDDYGYRNKAQYPIRKNADGEIMIGFYAKRSHDVIDSSECCLQGAFFANVVDVTREFLTKYKNSISIYDETSHKGLVRHLYVRHAEVTNQTMVCLVLNGRDLPMVEEYIEQLRNVVPSLHSVVININTKQTNVILGEKCITVYGSDTIEDVLCGLTYQLSPLSFYQVNHSSAEVIYGIAKNFAQLKKDDVLLDLYCGAGTIGLSMARDVQKLIGVEIIEDAVENATQNAKRNDIRNAQFFCDDASGAVQRFVRDGIQPSVVVLDPPRKGLTPEVISSVSEMNAERVVIVSCNVATLARDLKLFNELGYVLKEMQPVDMFPRTNHVECVCLLTRTEG